MEEQSFNQETYIKGFNEGYIIAEHLPSLSDQILPSLGDSDRSIGFRDGRTQFITDNIKSVYPHWLKPRELAIKSTPTKGKDKDRE